MRDDLAELGRSTPGTAESGQGTTVRSRALGAHARVTLKAKH